jgi:2-iminoacetate synthase ThiH
MSRTPAKFTQADVARTIRAAKQAGAREVVVDLGEGVTVTVKLEDPATAPLAKHKEIVL